MLDGSSALPNDQVKWADQRRADGQTEAREQVVDIRQTATHLQPSDYKQRRNRDEERDPSVGLTTVVVQAIG